MLPRMVAWSNLSSFLMTSSSWPSIPWLLTGSSPFCSDFHLHSGFLFSFPSYSSILIVSTLPTLPSLLSWQVSLSYPVGSCPFPFFLSLSSFHHINCIQYQLPLFPPFSLFEPSLTVPFLHFPQTFSDSLFLSFSTFSQIFAPWRHSQSKTICSIPLFKAYNHHTGPHVSYDAVPRPFLPRPVSNIIWSRRAPVAGTFLI